MNDFTIHGCEQVLRFSSIENWDDSSEALKVQLSFNMGIMALGLNLSKEEGYLNLVALREGEISTEDFHQKMRTTISEKNIPVNEENINKPF